MSSAGTKTSRYKILIVEDVEGVLKILGERFLHEGFETNLAQDGQEALKKALADPPDIILADVLMPIMDGLELARNLREYDKTRNIPVVLLSILERHELNHRYQSLENVVEVLWKNEVSMEQIVQRVKWHLK